MDRECFSAQRCPGYDSGYMVRCADGRDQPSDVQSNDRPTDPMHEGPVLASGARRLSRVAEIGLDDIFE